MATQKGVGAKLQLSVEDALREIARLQKELVRLERYAQDNPIRAKIVVDTSELDKAANKIKTMINGGSGSNSTSSKAVGFPKASELTQINQQLRIANQLLYGILGVTANLNSQTTQLRQNIKEAYGNSNGFQQFNRNIVNINRTIHEHGQEVKTASQLWLNWGTAAFKVGEQLSKSAENIYTSYRNFGQNLLTRFSSFANSVMETVGLSVTGMIDDALEQEKKLQQSQIGFGNMFNGDVSKMIEQVRTTASKSPGLNSGDLADYINQLGAVAGGNFDTAFNATMGVLKTVQYGGGDANSQMNYIIKNIRDVVAKGKGTQVDVQQFNRAMPLLVKSLQAIGASDFLKDGQLTITKDNASKLMEAFAQLNTKDNPAYDIFSQTANTLTGIQEEFRETTSTMIAKAFENLGFFEALTNIMRNTVFDEIQSWLDSLGKWINRIKNSIDWEKVGKQVAETMDGIKLAISEFGHMLKENFGNTEFIKLAVKVVGAFVEGLIKGATELGKFLSWLREKLGDRGLINLASSLGQAVTQGIILQKVLGGVSSAFSAIAKVLGTIAMYRAFAGAQGGTAGLLGGTASLASTASGASSFVLAGSSLKTGATLSKSIGATAVSAITRVGIGSIIGLLADGAAQAVESMNMFGDESVKVANILDVAGEAIQYGVYGSILGPLGALGGALIGAIKGINEAQARIDKANADATSTQVRKIKTEGADDIIKATIDTFRTSGGIFDEETAGATWVKNQLEEYLANTPAGDWDAETIYDKFVSAYRQRLGQEAMVAADNLGGFWNLKGEKLQYFTGGGSEGPKQITEAGERLVKLIRDYNLVGYDSAEALRTADAETLIDTYLKSAELNEAQLKFLEERATEFESTVGESTTESRDLINQAVQNAGGSLDQAIKNALGAGDEAFAKTLQAYKTLEGLADKTLVKMGVGAYGDKYWNADTATEILGEKGGEKYKQWRNRNNFTDTFNDDMNDIKRVYGTGEIEEIITSLWETRTKSKTLAESTSGVSDEVRQQAIDRVKAIDDFLARFQNINEGDWEGMASQLIPLAQMLAESGDTSSLRTLIHTGERVKTENGWKWEEGSEYTAEEWLEWFLKRFPDYHDLETIADIIKQTRKTILPIFKASGGMIGRGVDTVPAYLQPGEFVQRASAVSAAGLGVMNALNNGDLASAYRLIGSKINGHWNNSQTTTNNDYSQHTRFTPITIINRHRSSRASSDTSLANLLALG